MSEEIDEQTRALEKQKVMEYGTTPSSKRDPYVRVSIWNAETGKRTTRTLTKSKFATVEDLERAIADVRLIQKRKNIKYKESLISGDKVGRPTKKMLKDAEDALLLRKPLETKNSIDLILDKKTGNSTVIFGSSKRGKTTLMMHLYRKYYKNDKKFISTLFASNSQIPLYNKKENKRLLVSNTFNEKSEKYIRLQKFINSKTDNKYKYLVMFDDMIDLKNKTLLSQIVLSYRNSLISSIICLQYVYLLSKPNRANVNNIIIFGCNSNESTEEMVKTFCRDKFYVLGITRLPEQIAFFNKMTENYGFIYINNVRNTISFHRLDIRDM